MNDQYLQTSQGKLRYWEIQQSGTPLLLIPGFGASLEIWKNNFAILGKTHTIYALEPIGAGRSDKPDIQYTLDAMVNSIKEFVDLKRITKVFLIGSSLGGAMSLAFTTRFPHYVEKLILVGSAGFSRRLPIAFRLLSLPYLGKWLLSFSDRAGIQKTLESSVYDPKTITEEIVDNAYQISQLPRQRDVMLNILNTQSNFLGVRRNVFNAELKKIEAIRIPTLLIWGKQDPIIRFADSTIALKAIPHAQLHTFDQCGHLPQVEKPLEFNQLVLDFIQRPSEET